MERCKGRNGRTMALSQQHSKERDYMKQETELGRLESFVSSLLARYNALKEENSRLFQDVTDKDGIIEDLRDSLALLETERNEISNRVGGIIEQIEEWEKTAAVPAGQKAAGAGSEGRVQASLFSFEHDSGGKAEQE